LLQAYDSIATADFTLIVPEDDMPSKQLLFNLDMKQEKDQIIAVENHEIEEMEVDKRNDMDDEKTASTILVGTINDEQSSIGDQSKELDGTDDNKIKENSDIETSLVTVEDTLRNENADVFHLKLTMTNNRESAFEQVVTDKTIDNEMHDMESVQNVHAMKSDNTKEHVKETIVRAEEHKEEGMMVQATDNAARTIRMFRNSRETLVSTSLKSLKCHKQIPGNQ